MSEVIASLDRLVEVGYLVSYSIAPDLSKVDVTLSDNAAALIRAGLPAHLDDAFLDAWMLGGTAGARTWIASAGDVEMGGRGERPGAERRER